MRAGWTIKTKWTRKNEKSLNKSSREGLSEWALSETKDKMMTNLLVKALVCFLGHFLALPREGSQV